MLTSLIKSVCEQSSHREEDFENPNQTLGYPWPVGIEKPLGRTGLEGQDRFYWGGLSELQDHRVQMEFVSNPAIEGRTLKAQTKP